MSRSRNTESNGGIFSLIAYTEPTYTSAKVSFENERYLADLSGMS